MKKIYLLFVIIILFKNVFAQKTEFSISLNSGLFSFAGRSAKKTSYIHDRNSINGGYTNNPYGSRNGLCYGLSVNLKRITKGNLTIGIDLGYEIVRSKVKISSITGYANNSRYYYTAKGQTFLIYDFINVYPQIGYRFNLRTISFDLVGGLEIGYCLKTMEKGKAIANGTTYTTLIDRKTITTDIRARIQLSVNYHRLSGYVGYSYGSANYMSGYDGGLVECYARLIRFGIAYKIN